MPREYTVTELANLKVHEYADMFPMMGAEQEGGKSTPGGLIRLAEDMRVNGCHTPVVIHNNQLLDGRNRVAAAKLAKLTSLPAFEYTGSDPLMYVLSLNLHRRHLSLEQLSVLGRRIAEPLAERAAERQASGTSASDDAKVGKTSKLVSEALGGAISQVTLERAWAVQDRSPQLWRDVERKARSINDAYNTMQGPKQSPVRSISTVLGLAETAYIRLIDFIDEAYKIGASKDDLRDLANMGRNITQAAEKRYG